MYDLNIRHSAAAAVLALASIAPADAFAATVLIDDFSSVGSVLAPSSGSNGPITQTFASAGAIGGSRTVSATRTAPSGSAVNYVQGGTNSDGLGFVTSRNARGVVAFAYSIAGGVDLTGGGSNNGFDLTIASSSTPSPDVGITLTIGSWSATRSGVSTGTLRFNFDESNQSGLTAASEIRLTIFNTTDNGFAATFDNFAANMAAVPLPATGLLMIGALGGFSALRRRRKS